MKILNRKFGTDIVPRDPRLKQFAGRFLRGAKSLVSYPFEPARSYQVLGEFPQYCFVESAQVSVIYVERKLRWYHHLLNHLGARYNEVQEIHLDPMTGNLRRYGDGGTTDMMGDISLYLQKYRLYVKITEIGVLEVASSDLRTLGIELKGEVRYPDR